MKPYLGGPWFKGGGGILKLEILGHFLGVKPRQNILIKQAHLAQALTLRLATIWLFAVIFVHFWHACPHGDM